ncbi:MAG: carboxypeptidase regulatory-like domain-containing protein, partial [Blastocatellia bacterium]
MKTSVCRFLHVLLSVFAFAIVASLNAQDLDDVTLTGRITDSNGQAIVGATVTARLVDSGIERTVITDDNGRYHLIEMKPGTYTVKASATGFGAKERIDLQTLSGQNLQLDISLAPAGVQAEATVTVDDSDTPAVDTTRTLVGGTINEREIEEIPNNTRNPLDLVLTLGGTSEEQLTTSGLAEDRNANPSSAPLEQGNFSLSGGTAYSNNITIDGLDNNDDRSSRDRFQPSIEAIAEVQVISNQFSAEYGRASGGRVNLRTRAGGNRFRGRAFLFFRDDSLNANSWYNNSRAIPRPDLREINPGFTLSGPVVLPWVYDGRNKTFFSTTYEYN